MFDNDFSEIVRAIIATVAFAIISGIVFSLPVSFHYFSSVSNGRFTIIVVVFVAIGFLFFQFLLYFKEICRDLKKYAGYFIFLFVSVAYFSFSFSANAKFDNKAFHPNANRCAWIFDDDMTRELNAFYFFAEKSVFDKIGRRIFADQWPKRRIIAWKVQEISSGVNNANIRVTINSSENDRMHDIICIFDYWDLSSTKDYPNRLVKYVVSGNDRTHLYSSTYFDPISK